jgi:hypothetical protein
MVNILTVQYMIILLAGTALWIVLHRTWMVGIPASPLVLFCKLYSTVHGQYKSLTSGIVLQNVQYMVILVPSKLLYKLYPAVGTNLQTIPVLYPSLPQLHKVSVLDSVLVTQYKQYIFSTYIPASHLVLLYKLVWPVSKPFPSHRYIVHKYLLHIICV